MKTRKLQLIMILVMAIACVTYTAISFAEQAAKYAAEQEGKNISLAKTKEDMNVLKACLAPIYGIAVKPELTAVSTSISAIMPPAKIVPSLIQPDSTAIAAAPRPEMTTASEEKE